METQTKSSSNENQNLSFGPALEAIKAGKRATRPHYKITGIFLFARPSDTLPLSVVEKVKSLPESVKKVLMAQDQEVYFNKYLCLYLGEGHVHNGYVPTTSDIFAEDWEILED